MRKKIYVRPETVDTEGAVVPTPGAEYEVVLRATQYHQKGTKLWCLRLWETTGVCGSGHTTASWGHTELLPVREIGPLTHRPLQEWVLELDPEDIPEEFNSWSAEDEDCPPIEWKEEGGDPYYPSGRVAVAEERFSKTGRGHEKPVVWVFEGPSNVGKSTLASLAGVGSSEALRVYETDSAEDIGDDLVYAQIVVVGGKYSHTIEDVRAAFERHNLDIDLIPVKFG
jgi:hypothetical protein